MIRFNTHIARLVVVAGTILGATSCYGANEGAGTPLAQTVALDSARRMAAAHSLIGPAAKAALDSGNVLFRQKKYEPALAEYRAAADLAPQHAAPLFGMYMVARATNNAKLADSTLAEISKRNGEAPAAAHSFSDPTPSSPRRNAPGAGPTG